MRTNKRPTNLYLCRYVDAQEVKSFKNCTHIVRFVTTTAHELIGHGTGKPLSESARGHFNFDSNNPPLNPLTNKPEEYRATLLLRYLIDSKELLSILGYDGNSSVTADDR